MLYEFIFEPAPASGSIGARSASGHSRSISTWLRDVRLFSGSGHRAAGVYECTPERPRGRCSPSRLREGLRWVSPRFPSWREPPPTALRTMRRSPCVGLRASFARLDPASGEAKRVCGPTGSTQSHRALADSTKVAPAAMAAARIPAAQHPVVKLFLRLCGRR